MWFSNISSFDTFRSACRKKTAIAYGSGSFVSRAALVTSLLEDRAQLVIEGPNRQWKALVWLESRKVRCLQIRNSGRASTKASELSGVARA